MFKLYNLCTRLSKFRKVYVLLSCPCSSYVICRLDPVTYYSAYSANSYPWHLRPFMTNKNSHKLDLHFGTNAGGILRNA